MASSSINLVFSFPARKRKKFLIDPGQRVATRQPQSRGRGEVWRLGWWQDYLPVPNPICSQYKSKSQRWCLLTSQIQRRIKGKRSLARRHASVMHMGERFWLNPSGHSIVMDGNKWRLVINALRINEAHHFTINGFRSGRYGNPVCSPILLHHHHHSVQLSIWWGWGVGGCSHLFT